MKYSSYLLTTPTNIRNIGITGFLISIFIYSCSKNLPSCTGNCDLITFSGNVADFTDSQPISGQTINVVLMANNCIICSPLNVGAGSSEANGHFEIKKLMDTTLLQGHHMEVELTTTDNYITRIAPADSSVGKMYPRTRTFFFTRVDSSLIRMQFKIYLKTSLRINLHRNTSVISGREYFNINFGIIGSEGFGEAFIMSAANKDTFLLINTASNVFTNIQSSKFITYDSIVDKIDSIKCATYSNNSIDISY